MSRQENLPPDLKAVLSLLVGRHKSYAEIAGMLGIQERAVRDRAHSALALLAPRQARELSSAERELVGEYLLGQADPGQVSAARAHLESSAPARTWAQALTEELDPLATDPLPEIPGPLAAVEAPVQAEEAAAPEHSDAPGRDAASPASEQARAGSTEGEPAMPAAQAQTAAPEHPAHPAPSSRRGERSCSAGSPPS